MALIAEPLFRGHQRRYSPFHFNREKGRFAPPDGQAFGVMYLGTTAYCSFIEMFDFGGGLEFGINEEVVLQSCLCPVGLRRSLRVADLTTGPNLKRLAPRADNRISDGSHDLSRQWAAAIWAHPDDVDGILYRARNAPELFSVALFDRAGGELITNCAGNLLRDERGLADILDYFDCPLMP